VSLLSVDHALKAADAEAKGDSVCGLGAVMAVGSPGDQIKGSNHRRSA